MENRNAKGDYYTIVNSENGSHVHSVSKTTTKRILEAVKRIENGHRLKKGTTLDIRIRADALIFGGKKFK